MTWLGIIPTMVYSQELEKQVIGGLLKHQEVYPEISSILNEDDFFHDLNQYIFSIIKNALDNRQTIDRAILISRLKNLGVAFKDNIDITDYVTSLSIIQATPKSIIQATKDLKTITAKRNYAEVADKIKRQMIKGGNMSYDEVVAFVDKELYSKMNSWYSAGDSIDLFETMQARVEELGNNPVEDMGLKTPYPYYNKRYGGFRNGNVYVFASRPKQGKTSFLDSTAFHMANTMLNAKNQPVKIPTLILDTEMQGEEIQERVLAMLSGVPVWFITTGNWRKVPDYEKKIRLAWKLINENKYKLHHEYVINTPIEQIVNKIKRWYYTKVGRGNQCMIIYDYIKITGEGLSEFNKEHQVIGEKVNTLKELVGKEVTAPLVTAVQINRSGDNRREARDDSSVISLSDRVLWFASQVSIFRRKTPEEIQVETPRFGTHKLINIESRWQGKEASGHLDYVKDLEGNLVNNFTNFSVENFAVTEHADAKEMFDVLSGNAFAQPRPEIVNPFEDPPVVAAPANDNGPQRPA